MYKADRRVVEGVISFLRLEQGWNSLSFRNFTCIDLSKKGIYNCFDAATSIPLLMIESSLITSKKMRSTRAFFVASHNTLVFLSNLLLVPFLKIGFLQYNSQIQLYLESYKPRSKCFHKRYLMQSKNFQDTQWESIQRPQMNHLFLEKQRQIAPYLKKQLPNCILCLFQ